MSQVPNIASLFEGKRAAIDPRALQQDLVPAPAATDTPGLVRIIGPMIQYSTDAWCGEIEGYDSITSRTITALTDAEQEITVYIDSPGGEVAGLESAIDAICAARDSQGKMIHVQAGELLASAAYWLAIGICNGTLSAPKSAEIGSIGVLSVLVDESARLKNMGVSVKLVRNPDGKAPGMSADPLPDVAMQRERERVDEIAGRFFDAVATARGITADEVAAWNGATFTAEQAVNLRLVDHVKVPLTSAPSSAWAQNKTTNPDTEKLAMKRKAEDTPIEDLVDENEIIEAEETKTTATDVGVAAAAAATACEACAVACTDGTADEAMSAIADMISACSAAIQTAQDFLGAPEPDLGAPEPEGKDDDEEDEDEEDEDEDKISARLARLERRIEAQDRIRAMSKKRITAKQRAKLAAMTAAEFYAAIEFLPDRYDNKLAADITPSATRGGGVGFGLSANDLRACREKNIDPEKLAKIKASLASRASRK